MAAFEIVVGVGFGGVTLVGAAVVAELRAMRRVAVAIAAAERRERALAWDRAESAIEQVSALLIEARGGAARARAAHVTLRDDDEDEVTKVERRPRAPPPDEPEGAAVAERRTLLPPPSAKAT